MAKEKQGEAERTREGVAAELEKLEQAEQRIKARQEEITTQLAAGITKEVEEREKSLRSGYPAKSGKRSREARLELEDLEDQTQDVARLKARLELELANLDLADLDRRYQQAMEDAAEVEPRFKEVERELAAARLLANSISNARHGIRERINRGKQTLWQVDAVYRAEQEQEIEERRQREEEGLRRQWEEKTAEINAAVGEQNPAQIQVT